MQRTISILSWESLSNFNWMWSCSIDTMINKDCKFKKEKISIFNDKKKLLQRLNPYNPRGKLLKWRKNPPFAQP
jgi:hypothetical protein